jgi:hypothetical protein
MEHNIYDVIFPLLRAALWGEENYPFVCKEDVNWEYINNELKEQTIHCLPIDILTRVDKSNYMQYFQMGSSAMQNWFNLMQAQQNLYLLFQKEHIPFAILKGSAANYYYPNPHYRCMGNIDFIVRPEDFDRAVECMAANGYILDADSNERHNGYSKNNIDFELHRTFSFLKDSDAEVWQDRLIYDGILSATEKQLDGFSFPMLPPLENGLVLLTHINQHLEKGLGLRQIIDWMLYVDKEMTDEFWNQHFGPATDKNGLKTLAITVTKMCQMYLGLTKELSFCQDADPYLCEYLMDYVIQQGNFGRKRGESNNTAIRILGMKNIAALFSMLQTRGRQNWTATDKYPILRPFAWIYQVGRYAHLGLKRKNSLKQLKSDYSQGKSQEDFLNRLGVRRDIK